MEHHPLELGEESIVLAPSHIRVRRFGACEIALEGQEVESKYPPRTPTLPNVERPRGKEHGRKAAKREGMYREVLQVLCARSSVRNRG